MLLAGGLCFASCDEDEPLLPEPEPTPTPTPTPEPEPEPTPADTVKVRALAIQPDWSDALSEEHIPTTYNLFIGDTTITADAHILYMYEDSTTTEPYSILAYNQPEGITIADSIATINETEEGLLTALPGYLFAVDSTVEVAAGDTALVPLQMHRLLMPITLTLNFTEPAEVAEAEATLSGLVSAIHLPDGAAVGDNALRSSDSGTASLYIEELPDGEGIVMRLRTFGIVPELHQMLNVSVTLADGRVLTFESDLTGKLDDFAHLEPIALENTLDTAKPEEPEPEPEPEPTPEPEPEPEPEWPPYYPEWPPYDPEPDVPADTEGTITDWETVEDNIDIY